MASTSVYTRAPASERRAAHRRAAMSLENAEESGT
ncbi:hypothetical protein ABH926_007310 [Catenulispora sp. GP43]